MKITPEGMPSKTVVDSGNVRAYAPLYTSDGATITMDGTKFKLQPMIMDNILQMRYELWNQSQIGNGRFLDGIGYWFNSKDGVDTNLSQNIFWRNPGWDNNAIQSYNALTNAFGLDMSKGYGSVAHNDSWNAIDYVGGATVAFWIKYPADLHPSSWTDICTSGDQILFRTGWADYGDGGYDLAVMLASWGYWGEGFALSFATGWCIFGPDVAAVFDGRWHHVAWVNDGSTTKGYFDGVYLPNTSGHGNPSSEFGLWNIHMGSTDLKFRTGFANGSGVSQATLAGLIVSGSALSDSDIVNLSATAGVVPDYIKSQCVLYMPFSEGSGTTISDAIGHSSGSISSSEMWTPIGSVVYGPTNATLESTELSMQFIPSYAYASTVIAVGTNVVTTNDVQVYISRDNGNNWSYAQDDIVDTWDVSNKLVVGTCDLSGQPIDSNLRVRVDLSSNHVWKVLGIAAPCGE